MPQGSARQQLKRDERHTCGVCEQGCLVVAAGWPSDNESEKVSEHPLLCPLDHGTPNEPA